MLGNATFLRVRASQVAAHGSEGLFCGLACKHARSVICQAHNLLMCVVSCHTVVAMTACQFWIDTFTSHANEYDGCKTPESSLLQLLDTNASPVQLTRGASPTAGPTFVRSPKGSKSEGSQAQTQTWTPGPQLGVQVRDRAEAKLMLA